MQEGRESSGALLKANGWDGTSSSNQKAWDWGGGAITKFVEAMTFSKL